MSPILPDQRNIAQVFQFPVIYDTMTVRENFAFPLRNRGVDEEKIASRVEQIAALLEVEDMLDIRASNLSPIISKSIYGARVGARRCECGDV